MKFPLPPSWTEAAHALAAVLEAENAALRAADFAAAATLLPVKRAAIERMDFALLIDPKDRIRDAAGRLDQLAQQNRNLLADGIGVQAQVLRIIAGAVRAASHPGYGPSGQTASGMGGMRFPPRREGVGAGSLREVLLRYRSDTSKCKSHVKTV